VVRKAGVRVTDAEKQTGKSNEIPRLLKNLKKKKRVTEQLCRIWTMMVYHTRNLSLFELPELFGLQMAL